MNTQTHQIQTHQSETDCGSVDQTDVELLSLFAVHRDEAAFAELVRRHCGLVVGAELFEKIAPLDANLAAWHWKEASQAWINAKDKARALSAAKSAVAAGPEKRGDLLLHFWHRALGQVFLETGEPTLAIEHLEAAIKTTTIEGYIKECHGELAAAKEAAAKLEKK